MPKNPTIDNSQDSTINRSSSTSRIATNNTTVETTVKNTISQPKQFSAIAGDNEPQRSSNTSRAIKHSPQNISNENKTEVAPIINPLTLNQTKDTNCNNLVMPKVVASGNTNKTSTARGSIVSAAVVQSAEDSSLQAVTAGDTERIIQSGDNTIIVKTDKEVYVNTYEQITEQKYITVGGSGGGVTSIVAGSNVTISSTGPGGTGDVTVNSTGGGGGTPGGSDTQVQFNDTNSFGGNSGFTYNKNTNTVGLTNIANTTTSINVTIGTPVTDSWISLYGDLGVNTRDDYSSAVAYDSTGNIYSIGADGNNGTPFLVKYDSSGSIIWQKNFDEVNNYYKTGDAVEVDNSDNVYIIVGTDDAVTDFTLIKLDSSGTILWQLTFDDVGGEAGVDVVFDTSNNVYLTGAINNINVTYIAKVNSSGILQWQRTLTSATNYTYPISIAVDSLSNVYVNTYDQSLSVIVPYLVKYDTNGNLIWQKQFGDGVYNINSGQIAIDSFDNIYTTNERQTGGPGGYIALIKWDTSGNIIWQKNIDNQTNNYGIGLTTDSVDNIYVAVYAQTLPINRFEIYKFNSSGTNIWQRILSGTDNIQAYYYWSYKNLAVHNGYYVVSGYTAAPTSSATEAIISQFPTDGNGIGVWGDFSYSVADNPITTGSLVASAGSLIDAVGTVSTSAGVYTTSVGTGSNNLTIVTGLNTWKFDADDGKFGTNYYKLPIADGSQNTVLMTDGSGNVSWQKPVRLNNYNSFYVSNCSDLSLTSTGNQNVAIGQYTFWYNSTGSDNISIGLYSAYENTTGSRNIAQGYRALSSNSTGNDNIAIGSCSLWGARGSNNIGIGAFAGCNVNYGSNNTIIGPLVGTSCLCNTLLLGTGSLGTGVCERIKVDNTGLYINGSPLGGGSAATPTSLGTVYACTVKVMPSDYGSDTTLGYKAGNLGAYRSVVIGGNAGAEKTQGCNTVIGHYGHVCNVGSGNIAVGYYAACGGINGGDGYNNVAIGGFSMATMKYGICNVAIGERSLQYLTTGNHNVAIGAYSLYNNSTGCYNTAVGSTTLTNNLSGSFNVANGYYSLALNETGSCNIAVGYGALRSNRNSGNIGIGVMSGCSITTGVNNTIIGRLTGSAGLVCTVLIGAGTCERIKVDNSGLCINGATLQGNGLDSGAVGFRVLQQNSQSANYTTVASDSGKQLFHPSSDANPRTFTIDSNANVPYPIGTAITFINDSSAVLTIAITSDTLVLAGTGSTGSRSLAQYGVATAVKVDTTRWYINGNGIT